MSAKTSLFIGMCLFFFIAHYVFYSVYSYETKKALSRYSASIKFLFMFIGVFASFVWTALIFKNAYNGFMLYVTTAPSVLLSFIMLIHMLIIIRSRILHKKKELEDEEKNNQNNYLSLTRGRHYDFIIDIYNKKSNPLVTQRDYEIACIYKKMDSIVDILKSQNKYYELAIYYFLMNNFKESLQFFDLAGESNSNYKFFYNKGLCLYRLEKYEESVEAFDKALEFSKNSYAYFNRALAKARLNDVEGTLHDLKFVFGDKDIRNSIKIKRKLDFIDKALVSL